MHPRRGGNQFKDLRILQDRHASVRAESPLGTQLLSSPTFVGRGIFIFQYISLRPRLFFGVNFQSILDRSLERMINYINSNFQ